MPRIIVKKNGVQVDQYLVETGTITVGRTPDNQIVLNDSSVSRSHLEIKLDEDSRRITIVDLNSSNGTYVNGIRISRTIVSKAVIGVGVFQLELGTAEASRPALQPTDMKDVEETVMFAPGPMRPRSSVQPNIPAGPTQPAPHGSPGVYPGSADATGDRPRRGWLSRLFGKK